MSSGSDGQGTRPRHARTGVVVEQVHLVCLPVKMNSAAGRQQMTAVGADQNRLRAHPYADDGVGAEVDPPSATPDERAVLLRALTNLGADAAAMIPESMMIELVKGTEGGASSQSAHQSLLVYLDALISKAVLGQTLTTEAGERGARSLGEVHDAVRHDIERSDAIALSEVLTRDVARPIVVLNHGTRRRYPRIVIGREETLDVARTAEALAKLVPLGLRVPESAVRDLVGFEAPSNDDVLMARPPATPDAGDARGEARALAQAIDRFLRQTGATDPPPAPPEGAHDSGGDDLRALAATLAQSDPVPALTRRTRATVGPLVDAWGEQLGAVIGTADSLEAARDWLDAGAVESLEALTVADRLAPALIAAELAGRYDVDTDPVGADVARASAAVALGTASAEHTQLPFNEQIAFFRAKLSLPTAIPAGWRRVEESGGWEAEEKMFS